MSRSYLPLLLALGGIWGASYLFIKVAVDEIEPAPMMEARLLIAVALLVPFLIWRMGARAAVTELRRASRAGLVLGLINAAIPFTLIAWGEKHVDSGVAAIANATVPIFVVLLALRFDPSESVTGLRLAGVLLGLAGVGVLAGVDPEGGAWAVAGTLAVVLSSVSYAASGLFAKRHVRHTAGPVLAAASMLGGSLILLVPGLLQLPDQLPGWKALGSVFLLGALGTGLAQLILFRMVRLFGPQRLSLVTYIMPLFALLYGSLLLDEPLTAGALGGLALILAGVALGSGTVRPARREVATNTAP
jgi:drug/metabolite transporter (DMT)-like permease